APSRSGTASARRPFSSSSSTSAAAPAQEAHCLSTGPKSYGTYVHRRQHLALPPVRGNRV
ncbi:hypothetical protein, partial [Streptomyces sp. NPDC048845]|uniref:hypothetical protein n=1 Tax=Streptomyces sp. NPDC048845 TaxID=3155390 RepID=UPI0034354AD9